MSDLLDDVSSDIMSLQFRRFYVHELVLAATGIFLQASLRVCEVQV